MATEKPRPHQDFHLLEAWNVPDMLFSDPKMLKLVSSQLIEEIGLTIVGEPTIYQYDPDAASYNAFLSESGVNAHTWREYKNYINYLFHTCSRTVDFSKTPEIAAEVLQTDEIEFRPLSPNQRRRLQKRKSGLLVPA